MAQRYAMIHADVAAQTAHIHQQMLAIFNTLPQGSTVALFAPHAGEPDVLCLAQQLHKQYPQHTLCLPVVMGKVDGQNQALQFALWSTGESLVDDAYGIAVPAQKHWVTPNVLFIPCVGYTNAGDKVYRLGYGGGYYDRTLATLRRSSPDVQALGIAWRNARGVFEPSTYDVPMDALLLG